MAQIGVGANTQWIKRNAHTSVADLEQSIRDYIDRHNADPKPFVWHKSADTILASVARAASNISCVYRSGP